MRAWMSPFFGAASMVLLGCLLASCSKPKGNGKSYEEYPEFKEGGTMTLDVQGQAVTAKLNDIQYVNTGAGYPDFVEIHVMNTLSHGGLST